MGNDLHPTTRLTGGIAGTICWMGTKRFKSPATNEKKISRLTPPSRAGSVLETILGCKWSLTVYALIEAGVNRPGAMERSV
ncbi:MAG: hypothetical protein RL077_660, partial [Verrucomicrobiota bacterium]